MVRTFLSLVTLAFSFGVMHGALAKDASPDQIKVEITGTLKFGVVAIGAETTGVTITSGKTTWELDLGNNAELKKKTEALDGKRESKSPACMLPGLASK